MEQTRINIRDSHYPPHATVHVLDKGMAGSSTQQLKELRACFSNVEFVDRKLDAYIVPYNDEHQSEYLAECDKRVKFICGFSGSSGKKDVDGMCVCVCVKLLVSC